MSFNVLTEDLFTVAQPATTHVPGQATTHVPGQATTPGQLNNPKTPKTPSSPSKDEVTLTANLINRLTPSSSKQELAQLRTTVNLLQEQINALRDSKDQCDPRLFNNPLPNQATITYKYGARAYEIDCYPGFVWRNNHWYRITSSLNFVPDKVTATKKIDLVNAINTGIHTSLVLDDSYYPVIVNGTRLFVHETEGSTSYIYFPFTQMIGLSNSFPQFSQMQKSYLEQKYYYNNVYGGISQEIIAKRKQAMVDKDYTTSGVVDGLKFEYEDVQNMSLLYLPKI